MERRGSQQNTRTDMTPWRDLPSFFSICDTVALFSHNALAPSIFRFVYGYTIGQLVCS
jgi:hypothetical protein